MKELRPIWRVQIGLSSSVYRMLSIEMENPNTSPTWKITFGLSLFDVSGWNNIIAIAAGEYHTVVLKSDGTVVYAGKDEYQLDFDDWTDIVAISAPAHSSYTIGLKADVDKMKEYAGYIKGAESNVLRDYPSFEDDGDTYFMQIYSHSQPTHHNLLLLKKYYTLIVMILFSIILASLICPSKLGCNRSV